MPRNALYDLLMQSAMQSQDPRNQVPGMGSSANAVPYENPIAARARQEAEMADAMRVLQMISGGIGLVGAAHLDVPAMATGAVGGYVSGGLANDYEQRARGLRYQGN